MKTNLVEELKKYISSHSKEERLLDWQNICEKTKDIVDESDDLYLSPFAPTGNVAYVQVVPQTDEEKYKMYMTTCSKEELAKMLVQANKTIDMLENSFNKYTTTEKTF